MNKLKFLLFVAPWDRGSDFVKPKFYETCRKRQVKGAVIDVEDQGGVELSIRFGIRNVPAMIVLNNNRIVGKEKGNYCHEAMDKYIKAYAPTETV